jgi:hypothetical protein
MAQHQREMSRAQFLRELRRIGFKKVLMWMEAPDGTSLGMIYFLGGKPAFRASLAKAYRYSQGKAA